MQFVIRSVIRFGEPVTMSVIGGCPGYSHRLYILSELFTVADAVTDTD